MNEYVIDQPQVLSWCDDHDFDDGLVKLWMIFD